jgi:hypothetical protein
MPARRRLDFSGFTRTLEISGPALRETRSQAFVVVFPTQN